jgi:hypothetical protein
MAPECPTSVQPSERAKLAALFGSFIAGEMSVWRLERRLLGYYDSSDRGIAIIATEHLDLADALGSGWFGGWRGWNRLRGEQQACIRRCRDFLRTDLPYEWPNPPDLLLPSLGQAALLLVWIFAVANFLHGLVLVVLPGLWLDGLGFIALFAITCPPAVIGNRALRSWSNDVRQRYESAGDKEVWPFLRRADYERTCG